MTPAPLSDLPDAVRFAGRDLLASVEQAIRAAYYTGVSHGEDRGRAAGRDAEARYREALVHARDLVSHAPEDTWGYVESPDDEGPWPVRDELLYRIDAALSPEAPQ